MKKNPNIRNTIFGLSLVVMLVVVGVYVFFYIETSSLVSKALNSRNIVNASNMTRLQGKDIVKLYQDTETKRPLLGTFFVSANNAVPFIKSIESVGAMSGASVSISSIKAAGPEAESKTNIGSVSVTIQADGSWKNVMRALELFEVLPYKTVINRLSLDVSGAVNKNTGERNWKLSVDITAASLNK